jgi:hypothetical protein
MSLKRLAVLCLGLLICSTYEGQAQAGSDYTSTAYADLADDYSYVYYKPAYPATANDSFISSAGRRGLAKKRSRAVRFCLLSPYEQTPGVADTPGGRTG